MIADKRILSDSPMPPGVPLGTESNFLLEYQSTTLIDANLK